MEEQHSATAFDAVLQTAFLLSFDMISALTEHRRGRGTNSYCNFWHTYLWWLLLWRWWWWWWWWCFEWCWSFSV